MRENGLDIQLGPYLKKNYNAFIVKEDKSGIQ